MLRLGLTGGIGAGKSTVARALEDRGAVVIDADAISREVVAPGTEGLVEIVAEFGEHLLDDDGALDRPALASVVFSDDGARARLNAIVHPRVGRRTSELLAEAPDDAIVVHDVPLLVENGMGPAFALVLVVDAPEEERVRRLGETRGMSADDARARIRSQATTDARTAAADVWIDNSGAPGGVDAQVAQLWDDRVVPFEANLRAGTVAEPSTDVVAPDPRWAAQGLRLAARVGHAGARWIDRVEHVGPTSLTGRPAPDVVDLLVVVAEGPGSRPDEAALTGALAAAGFPARSPGRHGSADPLRPVEMRVLPASSDDARAILADPGRGLG